MRQPRTDLPYDHAVPAAARVQVGLGLVVQRDVRWPRRARGQLLDRSRHEANHNLVIEDDWRSHRASLAPDCFDLHRGVALNCACVVNCGPSEEHRAVRTIHGDTEEAAHFRTQVEDEFQEVTPRCA